VAIPLSDLRMHKGDRFTMTCVDYGFPEPHKHVVSVSVQ
jgi:hypothetical protein